MLRSLIDIPFNERLTDEEIDNFDEVMRIKDDGFNVSDISLKSATDDIIEQMRADMLTVL